MLAVEPEPHLYEIAKRNAGNASVPVEVVHGVAEELPANDSSFDAAVASLVLCSVADQQTALREMYRVIRPGGQLRFFEHIRANSSGLERVQRLLDATLWPRVNGGCLSGRDTVAAIMKAGFTVEQVDKARFPDGPIATPTSPHVLGIASRPQADVCQVI